MITALICIYLAGVVLLGFIVGLQEIDGVTSVEIFLWPAFVGVVLGLGARLLLLRLSGAR